MALVILMRNRLLAALLVAGSCLSAAEIRLESSAEAMGSTFTIVLYGDDRAKMSKAMDDAFAEVRRLDSLLSNYKPESEWSRVNREAARGPVKVSPESFDLLRQCAEYSRRSEGAFDITVGPLMKVWGFYKGTGMLPRPEAVSAALTHVGYRHMLLDAASGTVRFDRPGVELDPGGIGKGYAVDRMAGVLRRSGFDTALVAGAGSSIFGLGAPPGEPQGWRVKIPDPGDTRKSVAEVRLKDSSLSTSGSYEKFFWAEGRIYSHIMDPRTGYPARGTSLASVVAPLTIDSEAWTKPYFINGRRWAQAHRPEGLRVFLCDDAAEPVCGWVE